MGQRYCKMEDQKLGPGFMGVSKGGQGGPCPLDFHTLSLQPPKFQKSFDFQ